MSSIENNEPELIRAPLSDNEMTARIRAGEGEWVDGWEFGGSVYVRWSEWGLALRIALPWGTSRYARTIGIGGMIGPIGFYADWEYGQHLRVGGKATGLSVGAMQ